MVLKVTTAECGWTWAFCRLTASNTLKYYKHACTLRESGDGPLSCCRWNDWADWLENICERQATPSPLPLIQWGNSEGLFWRIKWQRGKMQVNSRKLFSPQALESYQVVYLKGGVSLNGINTPATLIRYLEKQPPGTNDTLKSIIPQPHSAPSL